MEHFAAFHDRYPPELTAWVASRGWSAFRDIQKQAITAMAIDPAETLPDLILEAETSSGKTEAAFLPLMARAVGKRQRSGFSVVYVSPLKALINDANERLETAAKAVGLPLYPWHSESEGKPAARRDFRGILLTTPESIEGFLVRATTQEGELRALAAADAIVVDELHAYFDTARGRHMQSLLHRLDEVAGRRITRIGLSATLGGQSDGAAETLRPKSPSPAQVLRPMGSGGAPPKVGVKVFVEPPTEAVATPAREAMMDRFAREVIADIADDRRSLIFANARAVVEMLYARVGEISKGREHFKVERHHSSVPKASRQQTERGMREKYDPETNRDHLAVICTNTLELGIDIGNVQRVIQIDPTFSVAALRQRVGRSGRREGEVAQGLIYVAERELNPSAHPLERLRLRTVQALATAQLSLEGAYELPNTRQLHLSTLYHQVISRLFELRKPVTTEDLHRCLVLEGPWEHVGPLGDQLFFRRFLEHMADGETPPVSQTADGWALTDHMTLQRHAYAVFSTPGEYNVRHGTKVIGRLPVTAPYQPGDTLVLAGGRWRVSHVADRTIFVARAPSASAPRFGGSAQAPSGLVTQRMRDIFEGRSIEAFALNPEVEDIVDEGRRVYAELGLADRRMLTFDREVVIFPWTGARLTETLMLALRREGLRAAVSGPAIVVDGASIAGVWDMLALLREEQLDLEELAREARQPQRDRFDRRLIPYYLRLAYARRDLTAEGYAELLDALLAPSAPVGARPTTARVAPSF